MVALFYRGLTLDKIVQKVGTSKSGVSRALRRIADGRPGRDPRAV
jgi:hypothetical protein